MDFSNAMLETNSLTKHAFDHATCRKCKPLTTQFRDAAPSSHLHQRMRRCRNHHHAAEANLEEETLILGERRWCHVLVCHYTVTRRAELEIGQKLSCWII